MANATKSRGTQLIRTDDKISGCVRFYRRDMDDAQAAFIGQIDVRQIPDAAGTTMAALGVPSDHPGVKLAVHGATQNVLDSSNKLDGDARCEFIRKACATVQSGGWSSAPADDAKVRENAEAALRKMYGQMGLTPEAINAAVKAALAATEPKAAPDTEAE